MKWTRLVTILVALVALGAPHVPAAAQPAGVSSDAQRLYSEDEAWRIGWPMLHGPSANFLPLRTGAPVVEDLLQARRVWESDERDFGSAKTGSQTFRSAADVARRLGPDAEVHPGNWAPVIVAEGKLFGASFRPAGPWREAPFDGDGETVRFRLDAEDLLIALDAATGKRLWKAVEPGGLVLGGGKRGGFQVAPAYGQGKVFSMGSTGRLFAYDAQTGRKLWQGDIGAAHLEAARNRDELLAAAAAGKWTAPSGPGWHTSLVVADGVLVVPTYRSPRGSRDIGLRGVDPATGRTLWEVEGAQSRWATPNVWPCAGREYVLCATVGGEMRLVDPRDGRVLWEVINLGPNYATLSPSPEHVLVNVAPADPEAKRTPGRLGAYRITPGGARLAWTLPDAPQCQISTWFDNCARQRSLIRDGKVYVATVGDEQTPGRFLLLDEKTGRILAEHVNGNSDSTRIRDLFYLIEDRLLVRSDHSHGPTHGGRHPFFLWNVRPGATERIDVEGGLSSFDLVEFATGYEVLMETPIVAGRIFQRTIDGTVVCCDLRRPDIQNTWSLDLDGGYVGMAPLPLRLWARGDGSILGGRVYPPTDREARMGYGSARRWARWERAAALDAHISAKRLAGNVELDFGSHTCRVRLDVQRSDGKVSGTWTRAVSGIDEPVRTSGALTGRGPTAERLFPTPWLADRPWTSFGANPPGTVSYVLQLEEAITLGKKPARLTLCLAHDGERFVRAGAVAFSYLQSWHEVDAGELRLEDGRIAGAVTVILNPDGWGAPNPATGGSLAGRVEIDTVAAGQSELSGTYRAVVGVPWTASGEVSGSVAER